MKKFIVAFVTTLALMFTTVPAYAGTVNVIEYIQAQYGWTKSHVGNVWDGSGNDVGDPWTLNGWQWKETRYTGAASGTYALAYFRMEDGYWTLRDKYWCDPSGVGPTCTEN